MAAKPDIAKPPRIHLASSSPRRQELLRALGIEFDLVPADVDERSIPYSAPRELALKAAFAKAGEVSSRVAEGIVIAADTIVVLNGKVYGKPDDPADARRMLAEISGHTHTVITGVAVTEPQKTTLLDAAETQVSIRKLTTVEIADYVATGEPLDKAGSYAAQGIGARIIERIDGDYHNVVGLPLGLLLQMLSNFFDTAELRCRLKKLNRS